LADAKRDIKVLNYQLS